MLIEKQISISYLLLIGDTSLTNRLFTDKYFIAIYNINQNNH